MSAAPAIPTTETTIAIMIAMLQIPKKLVQRIMKAFTSTYLASITVERE
jgi:hypothetical protein